MAGSKPTRWQKVAMKQMADVIRRPDFQKDVQAIRDDNKKMLSLSQYINQIIAKYNLSRPCYSAIREYVLDNNPGPIADYPSPIFLLSFPDGYLGPEEYADVPLYTYLKRYPDNHVAIDLTGEIQKQDLIDFINLHWKLIESKLKLIEPVRPGAVRNKQMDNLHLKVLELREKEGLSYNDIAAATGLQLSNVKQILYRMRKPSRQTKIK